MKKILLVVHQETSDPGLIGQVLRELKYELDVRCPALGGDLPVTMDEHEGAIIFGGPMSTNDEHSLPFIRTELDWLSVVLAAEKPYLGVCLGAQMLAKVLGARVAPHPNGILEIGYVPILPTVEGADFLAPITHVYHWHKEGFELPQDAVLLAEGETFTNQAFRYGETAYGVQFHPEITKQMIDLWTAKAGEQLVLPGAQPYEEHIAGHDRYGATVESWLRQFLQHWLNHPQVATTSSR